VAELVDALDSKSSSARSAGSIPARGTIAAEGLFAGALRHPIGRSGLPVSSLRQVERFMALEARTARLAVLIDADNASAKIADRLFEEIAKIGEASVRRIYGDFSSPRLKPWAGILAVHAILPHQQFAYTAGKNASDIALVIDAMDLLHTGRFDGFCLVSSDSDFTRLAARIREQGVDVYGFGEHKTPESFRQACRRFIYTENLLLPETPAPGPQSDRRAKPLQPPSAAIPLLQKALSQLETEEGWVSLRVLGHRLTTIATDFDSRTYGYRKLSDLVRETGAFEIHPQGGGTRVRLKPETAKPASSKGRRRKPSGTGDDAQS
jgi:uncharacterized LabA/DUF88 family protein